ncbi:MAG: hypothetical protein ABI216_22305, partial [Devosia sp.]
MSFIRSVATEIWGLFVDDGNLAILSLALIGVLTALVKLLALPPIVASIALLFGCLGILSVSVFRAARRQVQRTDRGGSKAGV